MTQPGTAGTASDPLAELVTEQVEVNGQTVMRLVGLAFDTADQTDGVLRFDGTGSTNGITDGSAKVIINGTAYNVAGGEWVDQSGVSHTLDSWEKVLNAQSNVAITGTNGPVQPGNTLDVNVDVSNAGTDQDTRTVTLDIDNSVGQVDSQSVTLSAGATQSITLQWPVPSGQTAQDYQATVESPDDTATQTVTVAQPVAPSLVSQYDFDGTKTDSVGSNDLSGSVTAFSADSQLGDQSAEFDGVDDRLSATIPTVSQSNDFSVAAWVKPNSASNVAVASAYKGGGDRLSMGFFSSTVTVNVYNGSFATQSKSFNDFGNWQHIVAAYDSSSHSMDGYLNGSAFTGSNNQGTGPDSGSFEVGYRGNGNHYDGLIDQVKVYDKQLTATEVSNLYNNGRI